MSEHSPFHCGSQAAEWEDRNCSNCAKGKHMASEMTCPIQKAVIEAWFGSGTVSEDIAERMGYLDNCPPRQKEFSYIWPCKELEYVMGSKA